MNRASLRKIAAATFVVCDENGGAADVFFILKSIYLADRQMLIDFGAPITGDRYSSMPQGPILCGTYDLLTGKLTSDKRVQQEWDGAFSRNGNEIRPTGRIDTDCLSPKEEETLREKLRLVMKLHREGVNVAAWMHENCPEWESVPKGHSKTLPLQRVLSFAKNIESARAKQIEDSIKEGLLIRKESEASRSPILAHR